MLLVDLMDVFFDLLCSSFSHGILYGETDTMF